jgi:hypothetical protein
LHLLAHIKPKIVIWDHDYQVDVIPFDQQFGRTPRLGPESENHTPEHALLRPGCSSDADNEKIVISAPKYVWLADIARCDQDIRPRFAVENVDAILAQVGDLLPLAR